MRLITLTLIILTALLLMAVPVFAQTETPPEAEPLTWTGTVRGRIVNGSAGGALPDAADLMLHAWDENITEKFMLHGESMADGTFEFADVTFSPDLVYAVMLAYRDVTYFSPPARIEAGQTALDLEVPIFEVTTDTASVVVDRMHVFFDAAPTGVAIGEVYVLSNLGDRTVADGVALDDGAITTVEFALPAAATNVTFDDPQRYIRTPRGFADTEPVLPGDGSSQLVVSYDLPYTDGMTFELTAPLPMTGVNLLVPASSGLSLVGPALSPMGTREMGAGVQVDIFSHESLAAGETLEVTISGEPNLPAGSAPIGMVAQSATRETTGADLAIGGAALGLALLAVGVWWYRRPATPPADAPALGAFDDLVGQIAALDAAHDRGDLDGADYSTRRSVLIERARAAVSEGAVV